MKVIYLCPFTGRCGGVKVIAEHTSRLAESGVDCEWWGLDGYPAWFAARKVPYRRFGHTDQLGAALRSIHGKIVIATWWQTAFWVRPNLHHGDAGAYLIQDDDQLTYSGDASGSSYKVGLLPITESEFVTRLMKERHGFDCRNVGIGIDHDVFRHKNVLRDRNRIFTTYRPYAGGGDLKGWRTAMEAVRRVREGNPRASLVTFGDQGSPVVPEIPHIHVQSPSDAVLRELYSAAGCYLMTSRHEGFCLPALEAMACGCPVVCTDAGGNMEYCADGRGAVVGRTVQELADGVNRVMASKSLDEWDGPSVAHRYQWDGVIDRLRRLFAGIRYDAESDSWSA